MAWHGQFSYKEVDNDTVVDIDVARAPQVMGRYTAATLAAVMGNESDLFGISPSPETLPACSLRATMTTSDSHSVNKLLSKWLSLTPEPNHFHLASYCIQHRTGSVCEAIGAQWGFMPGTFCLATQLEHKDFYTDVENAVKQVVSKYLVSQLHSRA